LSVLKRAIEAEMEKQEQVLRLASLAQDDSQLFVARDDSQLLVLGMTIAGGTRVGS
jgi:hypothetical protein